MRCLQSIKIEGGVPLDERRETIRALRHCPLERLTLIGINSVLGNTWGLQGRDLPEAHLTDGVESLEEEDADAINRLGFAPLEPPNVNEPFRAAYEWQGCVAIWTLSGKTRLLTRWQYVIERCRFGLGISQDESTLCTMVMLT